MRAMAALVCAHLAGAVTGIRAKTSSQSLQSDSCEELRNSPRLDDVTFTRYSWQLQCHWPYRVSKSLKLFASDLLAFNSPRLGPETRRAVLQSAASLVAGLASTPAVAVTSIEPSFVSSLQGSVQDAIAPGHWIGQFAGINSKTEKWAFATNSAAEVSAALVTVLDQLSVDRRSKLLIPSFKVVQADPSRVHVLTWTKAEWLDTLDVSFGLNSKAPRGCTATASFYATGLLPTSIPLAPLVNVLFAWFPFGSPGPRGEMLQDFRLRAIKGLLDKELSAKGA